MRDIRGDLQDRADLFAQQISIENARFERVILQVKTEHDNQLEHLRAQLRLANKLLEFTDWHHNVCATLTAQIAVAEVAETSIRELQGGVPCRLFLIGRSTIVFLATLSGTPETGGSGHHDRKRGTDIRLPHRTVDVPPPAAPLHWSYRGQRACALEKEEAPTGGTGLLRVPLGEQ